MTRSDDIESSIMRRAEDGSGPHAIAYAVLALTEETARLRRDLCLGTNFGDDAAPGALEMIAIQLGEMAAALAVEREA